MTTLPKNSISKLVGIERTFRTGANHSIYISAMFYFIIKKNMQQADEQRITVAKKTRDKPSDPPPTHSYLSSTECQSDP